MRFTGVFAFMSCQLNWHDLSARTLRFQTNILWNNYNGVSNFLAEYALTLLSMDQPNPVDPVHKALYTTALDNLVIPRPTIDRRKALELQQTLDTTSRVAVLSAPKPQEKLRNWSEPADVDEL